MKDKKEEKEMVPVFIGSGETLTRIFLPKGTKYLVGSGENALFAIAGETLEDQEKRYEEWRDSVIKKWELLARKQDKELKRIERKEKIKSLFRK